MKALIGLAMILAGAIAMIVGFANTDYNTALGPWWTGPAFFAGLVSAVLGLGLIGWWIVGLWL